MSDFEKRDREAADRAASRLNIYRDNSDRRYWGFVDGYIDRAGQEAAFREKLKALAVRMQASAFEMVPDYGRELETLLAEES